MPFYAILKGGVGGGGREESGREGRKVVFEFWEVLSASGCRGQVEGEVAERLVKKQR